MLAHQMIAQCHHMHVIPQHMHLNTPKSTGCPTEQTTQPGSWSALASSRRSASLRPNSLLSQQQQQAPYRDIVCAHSPELNGIVLGRKPRRHQASIREAYKPERLRGALGGGSMGNKWEPICCCCAWCRLRSLSLVPALHISPSLS